MADDFGDDADLSAVFNAAERSTPAKPAQASGDASSSKVQQPKPQALPARQAPSAILVSHRQRGNPILSNIKAVPWEWSDIPADFVLGQTTCALFLQLKYHRLHPEYIYQRIRSLGRNYNLRVLLTMVDIENHEDPLKELSKTSLINNLTLILCWSAKEAGHYLELFKSFENASTTSIRAPQARGYSEKLTEFVTTPRSINKTDALSLVANFGSLKEAIDAPPEEIAMVGGWGEKKVQRWMGAINEPFRTRRAGKGGAAGARDGSRPKTQSRTQSQSAANADGQPSASPVRRDLRVWEPGEEQDEKMLLAAAEENARQAVATAAPKNTAESEPETSTEEILEGAAERRPDESTGNAEGENLSEGVMAALARLREKG